MHYSVSYWFGFISNGLILVCYQGGDAHSTSRVLVAIVELCFNAGNWDLLNENVVILTKKRSQIKMAVTKMVQRCCEYVDQAPDKEAKLKLMDTLRLESNHF